MIKIETKVVGDEEVMRKIEELAKKNVKALKGVITKSVLVIEGKAKKDCPVLTGRLRSSLTYEVYEVFPAGYDGKVGTNVEYAPKVEFGMAKRAAKPYLFPALMSSRGDIIKFINDAIKGVKA